MLKFLHIENIAVIEQSDIEFKNGFNVLTGETGAGKSIVIDAINAVLGERTSKDLIRNGCENAVVSAVFGELDDTVSEKLKEYGIIPDEDGNIIITHTSNTLRVYNTDYEATEAWVAVQTIPNIPLDVFEMFSMDLSFIIAGNSNNLYRIQKQTDTNIVGLKYKEKYYYLKESEGES